MGAPQPDEQTPLELAKPMVTEPTAVVGVVTVAAVLIESPSGLVLLNGAEAPTCGDGACW